MTAVFVNIWLVKFVKFTLLHKFALKYIVATLVYKMKDWFIFDMKKKYSSKKFSEVGSVVKKID